MSQSETNRGHTGKAARRGSVPPGAPEWITAELIEQTIRTWQPYYQALLGPEDAVTMILNAGRLYQALSLGMPS